MCVYTNITICNSVVCVHKYNNMLMCVYTNITICNSVVNVCVHKCNNM